MNSHYSRLLQIIKPNSREIGQVYTLAIFKGLVALSLPLGIQSIINFIQGGSVSSSWLVLSILMGLAVAFNGYLQLLQMRIMENIQQHLFARAAFDISSRLPQFKMSGLKNYYAPELMNRFFEVLTIQKSLSKIIIELTSALMQILLGLILLSLYHSFFVIFSICLILFMFLILRLTAGNAMQSSIKESDYKYKVVSWLEELAWVRHSFKMSGKTSLPLERTDSHVSGYLESRENHFKIMHSQYRWLVVFKVMVTLFLLLVGGLLVINQQMNIGQFVAAEIIIMMVIEAAEKIILNLENFYDLFTSALKLEHVTNLPVDEQPNENIAGLMSDNSNCIVELIDLDFAYEDGTKVLFEKMNFKFEVGGKYYITGASGTGKSTLLHLIAGLYKPRSGTICFNNMPVSNFNMEHLYQLIGNGLREEMLFEGSLLENISLGRAAATPGNIQLVLENIFLIDFVKSLPQGLHTQIKPGGTKLPSSVVQKILLARTLVVCPRLVLLEQSLDAIPEMERRDIIKYLCESPEFTLIATTQQDYLKSHCRELLEISNGKLISKSKN